MIVQSTCYDDTMSLVFVVISIWLAITKCFGQMIIRDQNWEFVQANYHPFTGNSNNFIHMPTMFGLRLTPPYSPRVTTMGGPPTPMTMGAPPTVMSSGAMHMPMTIEATPMVMMMGASEEDEDDDNIDDDFINGIIQEETLWAMATLSIGGAIDFSAIDRMLLLARGYIGFMGVMGMASMEKTMNMMSMQLRFELTLEFILIMLESLQLTYG